MKLLSNSLLEWTDSDGRQEVVRVLHIDRDCDLMQVIRLEGRNALPQARCLSKIEEALSSGEGRILTEDPYAYLQKPEQSIPEKHIARRDVAWKLIEPIITAPNNGAFDPDTRGKLIREVVKRMGGCRKHVYRHLRRYWQAGMTRNALLPYWHVCGGPGKAHKAGAAKRGRPRRLTQLMGAPPGINISPSDAKKLRKGYRMFYDKAPEDGGESLNSAYVDTLGKFFNVGFERRGTGLAPKLPPADEAPTFDQFLYWGRKEEDVEESLRRRKGERKFNLTLRPVLGDSTLMAYGPGSQIQIDSTPADVWAVNSMDRARRLGRLRLYFVVDTFTHMITGIHVGLEEPSFFAAGLAIENSTVDKVAYCAQYGIKISSEEWPSIGLPESILADRGELEGYGASDIVNSLGIRVSNTSPYRADMKAIVERTFRSMNDLLIHKLPGAVRKPKERGERDPRLDAVLTLDEFRFLLIHSILLQNGQRIEGYRLQPDMIEDHVEPRPVQLWAWGIVNRSGHLRQIDPKIVSANLLPGAKATVTYRGIKFRGLYYFNELALRERWFVKARANGSQQRDVVFDPRRVDTIWVRTSKGLEPCNLVEADRRFAGKPWEEVEDVYQQQFESREMSKTADLQSKVGHQAEVDAVVEKAVEAAAIANHGLTKAARLRGVRENRKEERLKDWAHANGGSQDASISGHNETNGGQPATEAQPTTEYVPPPLPLEMLRKQREARMNNDEY